MRLFRAALITAGVAVAVFLTKVFVGFWRNPLGLPDDDIR